MVELECPAQPSTTGAYRLSWTSDSLAAGSEFVLREDGRAEPVYVGPDTAATLSGQPAGTYRYTVSARAGGESSCEVEVAPPGWHLVGVLFGAGLLVTLLTIGLVVRGHLAHRRGDLS